MKIALCFSGQPRDIEESYPYILKNLISPNEITDVFVHTWWRPEWETSAYTDSNPRPPTTFKRDAIDAIKRLYSPLRIQVEDDLIYRDEITRDYAEDVNWNVPGQIIYEKKYIYISYPRYLSVLKSNSIKNEYEKEQGFEYDIVIKMRLDLIPRVLIDLKKFDVTNYFYVPTGFPQKNLGVYPRLIQGWCGVNDELAIGNKKNMDIYCNIFNNLKKTTMRWPTGIGEGTLGNYLEDRSVPIYFAWVDRKDICVYRQILEGNLIN